MPSPSTPRAVGAEPFLLPGGSIGIVLIHGYGGSIGDYRSCGEQLQTLGYTVHGVCLAGHGQGVEVLQQTSVPEMVTSVRQVIDEVRKTSPQILLVGSSFGATLALALAEQQPVNIQGVVVVNPALSYRGGGIFQGVLLRILKLFTPYYTKRGLTDEERRQGELMGSSSAWPIDGIIATSAFAKNDVLPKLATLSQPLLILESSDDPVVDGKQNSLLLNSVQSTVKQCITLPMATHRPFRHPQAVAFMVKSIDTFIRTTVATRG